MRLIQRYCSIRSEACDVGIDDVPHGIKVLVQETMSQAMPRGGEHSTTDEGAVLALILRASAFTGRLTWEVGPNPAQYLR
jgi:hypothetical protein